MKTNIRKFKLIDKKEIIELIQNLYKEDANGESINLQKINRTFKELFLHSEKGSIFVIEDKKKIIGYAIIINYWSNELGGNVLFIDEIYIHPDYRDIGVGTNFINYLIKNKISSSVGIQLEITKSNKKAKNFYEKLGFDLSDRIHMIYKKYKNKKNRSD